MIGKTINNRYKLEQKIGGGGMAEVYKAIDLLTDTEVAVKILRQQYVHDDDFIKRFRREAHSVASLSDENVVDIFDVGEDEDIYYIVMEYVKGYTLKEYIQNKGRVPIKEAIKIATKIASALDHAHLHHIVHRDIKPHNILIGIKGEVKVTDFGIARAVSQATITHTGSVLGSVHYLSPEQARGGWTDEKSDLYSLGIVLYEMVTGELPFSGDSPITVALKHLQESFIYPKEINNKIPQSVENIILKALVKDPTKRYASAKEMLADLKTALDPNRMNEPRVVIDTEQNLDDEKTMIIPALTEHGLDHDKYNGFDDENETIYPIKSRKSKRRSFLKGFAAIILLSLLVVTGYFGYGIMMEKLVVQEIKVPKLEGMKQVEAVNELEKVGLTYETVERNDPVVKEGIVIKQEPYQGSLIKVTQPVTLYVSLGKEKIEMPDMVGKQQNQAKFLLKQKGFLNVEVIPTYDESTPSGQVFKQEPSVAQLVVPEDEKVLLFVSKGKENFPMPNLIGLTETEAIAILAKNDLDEGKIIEKYSFDQPEGRVFRQFPYEPGREVTAGDQVDLYISKGYPPEAKKITTDLLVLVYDENTDVSIIVNDSRERDILWTKESIDSTKLYDNIELILLPGSEGVVRVYKDGKLYQTKKVKY